MPFNTWWRSELERLDRRPLAEEINAWYHAHSHATWNNMEMPTLQETRVHAKCLRSVDAVRHYFRRYRAHKRGETDGEDGDDDPLSDNGELSQASDDTHTNAHHTAQPRKRPLKYQSLNVEGQHHVQQAAAPQPSQIRQSQVQAGYGQPLQDGMPGQHPAQPQQHALASVFFPASGPIYGSDQMGQIPVPPPPPSFSQPLAVGPPMPPARALPFPPPPSMQAPVPPQPLSHPVPPQPAAQHQHPSMTPAYPSQHLSKGSIRPLPSVTVQHSMQQRGSPQMPSPQTQAPMPPRPPAPPPPMSGFLPPQPPATAQGLGPAQQDPLHQSALPPHMHPLPGTLHVADGDAVASAPAASMAPTGPMADLPSLRFIKTEVNPSGCIGRRGNMSTIVPDADLGDMPSTAQVALGFLGSPLGVNFSMDDEQLDADLKGILSELNQGMQTPTVTGLEWAAAMPTPQSLRKLLQSTPDSIARLRGGPFGDAIDARTLCQLQGDMPRAEGSAAMPITGANHGPAGVAPGISGNGMHCCNATGCTSAQLPPVSSRLAKRTSSGSIPQCHGPSGSTAPTPVYAPMSSQATTHGLHQRQAPPCASQVNELSPPQAQQCLPAPRSWTQLPDHVLAALHAPHPPGCVEQGASYPAAKRQRTSQAMEDLSCSTALRLPHLQVAGHGQDGGRAVNWLGSSWDGTGSAKAVGAPSPLSQLFEYEMSAQGAGTSCNAWDQPLLESIKLEAMGGGGGAGSPGLGGHQVGGVPPHTESLPLLGLHIPPIHTGLGMGTRASAYLPTFDSIMASLCSPRM